MCGSKYLKLRLTHKEVLVIQQVLAILVELWYASTNLTTKSQEDLFPCELN